MQIQDQLGRHIHLDAIPQRIVCLVPSLSELLCDLGLEAYIVGITKFCVHPGHLRERVKIVGGTKNFRLQEIIDLNPHIIIAAKEENTRESIEELAKIFPVYVSDIRSIEDNLRCIEDLGKIFQCQEKAEKLQAQIHKAFDSEPVSTGKRVVYFIWKDPYMCVGRDNFIGDILKKCGFIHVYSDAESRYPEIDIRELQAQKPDYLFLSSEPYPFSEKHREELAEALPGVGIYLVDGELFSWYGSRFLGVKEHVKKIITELEY